jgi:hypothetical protein
MNSAELEALYNFIYDVGENTDPGGASHLPKDQVQRPSHSRSRGSEYVEKRLW